MSINFIPVQLRTGSFVRIDGRRYIVGSSSPEIEGRVFSCAETGAETPLPQRAILQMIHDLRLTTDAAFRLLPASVLENLRAPLDAFSDLEKESAFAKRLFVKAVEALPIKFQNKKKHLQPLIDEVMKDPVIRAQFKMVPTTRRVRAWFVRWIVAGRDIRALIDNHRAKGNRTARLPEWMREVIKKAIDAIYRNEIVGTKAQAWRHAEHMIRIAADDMGIAIPDLGQKDAIGKNLVARIIDQIDVYSKDHARLGKREADRRAKAVRVGPDGQFPLGEVEVDHTLMDWILVDGRGRVLGRPWITALIDRWTRMIIGFVITFHPPSWTSVMEALRIGVSTKEKLLEGVVRASGGAPFRNPWPCFGAPDFLFCDNGREFRSTSMRATEAALDMEILDLPRASGWLKGRIESWFKTANEEIVHIAPGTTKSNPKKRGNYKSEDRAVLTIEGANWVIAKWIVDVYHTKIHPATNETPIARWTRGMNEVGPKPAPPEDLLVPLTGLTAARVLHADGIHFKNLVWNSNEFSKLKNSLGHNTRVEVRLDPLDISKLYVLDPGASDPRRAWKEGYLEADDATASMTLHQYEVLRKKHVEYAGLAANDPEAALARARSYMEIIEFFNNETRKAGKAPKRGVARFVTDGRNASEHLRQPIKDPEESARPVSTHDLERPSASARPDERGPYRKASMPEPPPVSIGTEL